jgi:hypothetical protein
MSTAAKLTLVCRVCSQKVRSLTAADVPERGIVCRCGTRLYADSLKKPTRTLPRAPQHGPGTELKKLLAELGITSFKGCDCESKAAQMNRWGVEGCRERFYTLRGWIVEAQEKAGWLATITAAANAATSGLALQIDPLDVPGSLVRLAIERAESNIPPPS